MADGFTFQIVGDASKADQSIAKVVTELEQVVKDAGQAGRSITSAFTNARASADQAAAQAKQAAQANTTFAQRINAVADQLAREQKVLQQIQGPQREYMANVKALDSLLHQGEISAEQYAEALEKAGRAAGHTPRPQADTGGGSQFGKLGASTAFIGGAAAAGGAAFAGMKAGADAIADYIQAQHDIADAYTNLTNSAARFTDRTKDTNAVLREQSSLAASLQSTLLPTMDLYDAIGDVTGDLGLSQRELLGLTKNLGQAALTEGKSMEAAGTIMGRLSIAMQSGADGGAQLQKIFRDFPPLGQALAAAWDTDTAGVINMVSEHKRGIQDIIDVWKGSIPALQNAVDHHKMTYAQQEAVFKEKVIQGIGQGYSGMASAMAAANGKNLADFKTTWNGISMTIEERGTSIVEVMNNIINTTRDVAIEQQRLANQAKADAWMGLVDKLGEAYDGAKKYADVALHATGVVDEWRVAEEKSTKATREHAKAIRETEKAFDDLDSRMRSIMRANYATNEQIENLLNKDLGFGPASAKQTHDAAGNIFSAVTGAGQSIFTAGEHAVDNTFKKSQEDMAKAAEDAAQRTREAWAGAAGSVIGDLIRMDAEGKKSTAEMVDEIMRKLAMVALQQAALSMGGSSGAFLSGLVGALGSVPGHAEGTQFTVGGSSGRDANLYMMRLTRGERVTVETEAQQRDGTYFQGGGGGVMVVNNYQDDPRAMRDAMASPGGQRVIYNQMKRYRRRGL